VLQPEALEYALAKFEVELEQSLLSVSGKLAHTASGWNRLTLSSGGWRKRSRSKVPTQLWWRRWPTGNQSDVLSSNCSGFNFRVNTGSLGRCERVRPQPTPTDQRRAQRAARCCALRAFESTLAASLWGQRLAGMRRSTRSRVNGIWSGKTKGGRLWPP